MMVVMVMPMPAVPPVMMVVVMAVPPMHFRCLGFHVFLNRRGGAGIAERDRTGRACKREHRADGGEPQYFRELHEYSPRIGVTSAPNRSPQRCAQSEARNLNGF
jgi:hypothetical protein